MKKLIFVMVAALSLMFVSCDNKVPKAEIISTSQEVAEDSISMPEEVSEVVEAAPASVKPGAVKPGKPELKEGVDVSTPAKPVEEVHK